MFCDKKRINHSWYVCFLKKMPSTTELCYDDRIFSKVAQKNITFLHFFRNFQHFSCTHPLVSELASIEVLRMDFRHVELKFSMALCSSRDKGRVSYFQRPGLRVASELGSSWGAQNSAWRRVVREMRVESVISSGQVRGLVSVLGCQVEVLRMNFRHVEVKFSMALCSSRDEGRVSYFQRPG